LGGHDIQSDRVKTFVLLTLLGDACKDVLKDVGLKVGQGFAKAALKRVPGKMLIEINKRVGFRLLTKAGEKGAVNLVKMIPLAGGFIGGAFDAAACQVVGKQAKNLFYNPLRGNGVGVQPADNPNREERKQPGFPLKV
ncbi:MAG: hypothetical protein Q8M07_05660, partial [Prosthecobacter sp.]|nr:hypothetical protein [Prosthecobacter sp.]